MDGEFLLPYTPEDRGCDYDEARKLFVRNIQIVGDQYESPWQRFIILPCVEDQKVGQVNRGIFVNTLI